MEVYSTIPLEGCAECGRPDSRFSKEHKLRVNLFASDPRTEENKSEKDKVSAGTNNQSEGLSTVTVPGTNGLGQSCQLRCKLEDGSLYAQHPDGHWLFVRKATPEELELVRNAEKPVADFGSWDDPEPAPSKKMARLRPIRTPTKKSAVKADVKPTLRLPLNVMNEEDDYILENWSEYLMESLHLFIEYGGVITPTIDPRDRTKDRFVLFEESMDNILFSIGSSDRYLPVQAPKPGSVHWKAVIQAISDYHVKEMEQKAANAEHKRAVESLQPWQKKALGFA
jgi:hypothetical protein